MSSISVYTNRLAKAAILVFLFGLAFLYEPGKTLKDTKRISQGKPPRRYDASVELDWIDELWMEERR